MKQGKVFKHRGTAAAELYHYTECGLDDVYLCSGYTRHETPYGEGVSIKDSDDLHRAIGHFLVTRRKALSGKEIRFLRDVLDLTQAQLGQLLGYDSQTMARWEKEQTAIQGGADRLLRLLFLESIKQELPLRDMLEALDALEERLGKVIFKPSQKGWKTAA